MFKLDKRLLTCAGYVRPNTKVVDVGSDHAYTLIWLVKNNLIKHAIASDLREGPLLNAKNNIKKYKLTDQIETRLSDGLDNIFENEIDDIIISGIGGELIINIIQKTSWLKNKFKHLILQPMSFEQKLREFLKNQSFKIISEKAVISHKKVYTVMSVFYTDESFQCDSLYPYVGLLTNNLSESEFMYIKNVIKDLKNKKIGFLANNQINELNKINKIINSLENIILKYKGDIKCLI